jgi:hypothetical protein
MLDIDILIIGIPDYSRLAVLHWHWQKMIAGVNNSVKENLFIHTFKKGATSLKSLSISLLSYYTWLLHKKNLKMARISIKHNYISMSTQ